MKLGSLLLATSMMTLSVAAVPACAQSTTFNLTYSGLSYGNTASATGSFTIDDSALTFINAHPNSSPAFSTIKNINLTITGATTGNGTFSLANFDTFYFNAPSALDFSKELIGQSLSNGFTYGDRAHSGSTGDFNLFGTGASQPYGVNYFDLATSGGSGNQLALTSIKEAVAAVPEPATWAMMFLGLGAVGFAMRRREKVTTRVSYAV